MVAKSALYDRKFVTAKPSYQVARGDTFPQTRGDTFEQFVTDVMPQGIIYRFELVYIDVKNCKSIAACQIA